MSKTPLARQLQKIAAAHAAEDAPDVVAPSITRRAFLKAASAAVVTAALPQITRAANSPSIAIIGAGLAGLTAAYRLRQAGYAATIYEASTRAGGRCFTGRGDFNEGQIIEHGGELIDTGHRALRKLAGELGLQLDDLLLTEPKGTGPLYFFDGAPYTFDQAAADFSNIWPALRDDLAAAGYPTQYFQYTKAGQALDRTSIDAWIETRVPGGLRSRLGQLLSVAYNIEYGAETRDQSSLNLLYLLGYSGRNNLALFGGSDERYHVRGGNDLIVSGLLERLGGRIETSNELVALRRNANGGATLTFRNGSAYRDVTADRVLLALPFSILRRSVDYRRAGFDDLKRMAIEQLGMGSNTKLQLQFSSRLWTQAGANGDTFADTGYQATWEVTRGQPGTSGILVNYTGGEVSLTQSGGTVASKANAFLNQIEPVLPGLGATWNGKATRDAWSTYAWTRGSYSYYRVGQYTAFSGAEREISGSVHFAGEHTSRDSQGYLNGAVESGDRAASEIADALK